MVTCAWCDEDLTPAKPASAAAPRSAPAAVSHGICRSCLTQQLAALAPLPAAVSAPGAAVGL